MRVGQQLEECERVFVRRVVELQPRQLANLGHRARAVCPVLQNRLQVVRDGTERLVQRPESGQQLGPVSLQREMRVDWPWLATAWDERPAPHQPLRLGGPRPARLDLFGAA